jgi:hypothetical protein
MHGGGDRLFLQSVTRIRDQFVRLLLHLLIPPKMYLLYEALFCAGSADVHPFKI